MDLIVWNPTCLTLFQSISGLGCSWESTSGYHKVVHGINLGFAFPPLILSLLGRFSQNCITNSDRSKVISFCFFYLTGRTFSHLIAIDFLGIRQLSIFGIWAKPLWRDLLFALITFLVSLSTGECHTLPWILLFSVICPIFLCQVCRDKICTQR